MNRPPKALERLSDRDLWVLRQVRFKVGEWSIGDRVAANCTAHEAALLLRTIDFAVAAEEYLRAAERRAKADVPQIEQRSPAIESGEVPLLEETPKDD